MVDGVLVKSHMPRHTPRSIFGTHRSRETVQFVVEKGVPRLDRLRLTSGSGLAGGHGGQALVGRTLPLEEGLGSGEKLAETLLLLLLLGRRGPGLRRRAHDVDWLCVTGRL